MHRTEISEYQTAKIPPDMEEVKVKRTYICFEDKIFNQYSKELIGAIQDICQYVDFDVVAYMKDAGPRPRQLQLQLAELLEMAMELASEDCFCEQAEDTTDVSEEILA